MGLDSPATQCLDANSNLRPSIYITYCSTTASHIPDTIEKNSYAIQI